MHVQRFKPLSPLGVKRGGNEQKGNFPEQTIVEATHPPSALRSINADNTD